MVPRLESWGTTVGPQGKGHHADFPFLFPRVPSKAQFRCSWTWAPVPQVSYVEQPKEQKVELPLLPLVSRSPTYPCKHFASSRQWPRSSLLLLQTSEGGTIFPCLVLGLLTAGAAHGRPAEVCPALCRCSCDTFAE